MNKNHSIKCKLNIHIIYWEAQACNIKIQSVFSFLSRVTYSSVIHNTFKGEMHPKAKLNMFYVLSSNYQHSFLL